MPMYANYHFSDNNRKTLETTRFFNIEGHYVVIFTIYYHAPSNKQKLLAKTVA